MKKLGSYLLVAVAFAGLAQAQAGPDHPRAREAVVSFLQLSPAQVAHWDELWAIRQAELSSLMSQLRAKEEELRTLLSSSQPDPTAVGNLMLEINQLRQQLTQVESNYREGFEELLTPEQQGRLQFMRRAQRVVPLIPAFEAVGLLR